MQNQNREAAHSAASLILFHVGFRPKGGIHVGLIIASGKAQGMRPERDQRLVIQSGHSGSSLLHICRTVDAFGYSCPGVAEEAWLTALLLQHRGQSTVMKIVTIVGATLALVTAASAADIPRAQPVYQTAQVGKMPIGKTPIGKTPVGKTPVAPRPYTRY